MCVFLGYPSVVKGYKLYDVVTKQIFISRDVIFHEEIYPFHTVIDKDQLIDPFPYLVLPIPIQTTPQDAYTDAPGHQIKQSQPIDHIVNDDARDYYNGHPLDTIPVTTANIRKSQRTIKPPTYLKDFHCNLTNIKSPHHIGNFISYANLSASHKQFVLNVSSQYEP